MNDSERALADRLRTETQALHVEAERSGYIQEILKRRASLDGYALFLRNLLPAYQAMEAGLERLTDQPAFQPFDWPKLYRAQAITGDLEALAGPAWKDDLPILAEAQDYANRIDSVAGSGAGLLGHAYVRYVGDLSGGQIVKRLLSSSPGLAPEMLTFYDFPAIDDADAFKDAFRDALGQAAGTLDDADAVVEEARTAFRLNIAVSHAVRQALSDDP
jgi:heme oxygenase